MITSKLVRLELDVSDMQNCRQEDDFACLLVQTFLALVLHRSKIIISLKSQVRFILLKACFLFHSNVALLTPPWNSEFKRLLGLWNSIQSSFANTSFNEGKA